MPSLSSVLPRRITVYLGVALILGLGAWFLPDGPPDRGSGSSGTLTLASELLGLFAGLLAILRYAGRREGRYLLIGVGFLASVTLAIWAGGGSALLSQPPTTAPPGISPLAAGWGWILSSSILALFLAWSVPAGEPGRSLSGRSVRTVSLVAVGLVAVALLVARFAPIPGPVGPIPRPWEAIPTLLFAVALAGYLRGGGWRMDPFQHWLVIALVISIMGHGFFAAWSVAPGGTREVAARLLQAASVVSVMIGLFWSILELFRQEEESGELHRQVNASLAREISVWKEAESVLLESEERLQDFLDSANDLIQITDPEGELEYANPAWRMRLGFEEDDLSNLSFFEIVHPSSREAARKGYAQALSGSPVVGLELRLVGRDDRELLVRTSMNSRLVDGEPRSVRSILRDISDERRARDELVRSEANLSAIVESTGDAIWAVDPDLRLISFNSAFALMAEAITGREPVIGGTATRGLPPEDETRFREAFERALKGERFAELWQFEVEGQRRAFELYFNPILEGFRVMGAVVFLKDVTRRVRAEEAMLAAKEEAEQANRSKSQFLANMSHELRTPLNSVIGFANILVKREAGGLSEKDRSFLERILANGKHLLSLINEILDLAKIEAGRMDLELEGVRLQEFLPEVVAQLESQVRERPIELRAEVPEELDDLQSDAGKLRQVLINLVGNALKFTEEGSVTIRVEALATHPEIATRIAVHDTGPGIPANRLDAIFEAFQQADGTTARRFGGTGLGLSISRSLCNLMGYDLTVRSRVGEGSTFSIELNPRLGAPDGVGSRDATSEPFSDEVGVEEQGHWDVSILGRSEPPWVLVVDAEPDSRILLGDILEDLGCRVATASGGAEGIELAQRLKPDLMTLDLHMPGMGGWSVLQTLKGHPQLQDVPILVVSNVSGDTNPRVFGAAGFVSKPVERSALVAAVRAALAPDS